MQKGENNEENEENEEMCDEEQERNEEHEELGDESLPPHSSLLTLPYSLLLLLTHSRLTNTPTQPPLLAG